jgi:L-fuconolactonase
MKILQQDYLPEHLSLTLKRTGVDACVAIHADQSELETHFLVELAKTHPVIKGVVGWVDFRDERIEKRLHYFSQYPIIKGWRHIAQSEPNDFLLGKDFQRGIKALQAYNYTFDILIYHYQLKAAIELVSKFPDQKFVLDHCGKPDIKNKNINDWKANIKELAKHPNVYCKVSGLFTEADWKDWRAADFYPYLEVIFSSFGVNRLLFGSDWPVVLLSGMYVQWKSLLEKFTDKLDEESRENIFGKNAIAFYAL